MIRSEGAQLTVHQPELVDAVSRDPRFVVGEVPLVALVRRALPLFWTR